jgi:predicted metal-dependent phosphoesterase TrpH
VARALVIDLHLHTTISDGRCTPHELVDRAAAAGLSVMAVTDHDTVGGVLDALERCATHGIVGIPGIEITAVEDQRDVHMLAYFFDPADRTLLEFLAGQREVRIARVQAIAARLDALGMPVDVAAALAEARTHRGRSIGRPKVARAMVDAGYVADTREAFDRWLGRGGPAFVPRTGAAPEQVIAIVHAAGGLVSLAHPGRTRIDERIAALRDAGLDALEVYHPDHDGVNVARYRQIAAELGLLVTGGSDFHGDPAYGVEPGAATLPRPDWDRLLSARDRHARH